jgi:hypothetical protein
MADKAALEMIGVLLFVATLFVIGAGGFAVRHQLAANEPRLETAELTQLASHLQTVRAGMTPAPMHALK